MGRTCTVCNHSQRDDIDRAILAGQTERAIARQYRTGRSSVQRHKCHVSVVMARTIDRRRERSVTDQMRDLLDRCMKHLAERGRKPNEMAFASREVRETIKVLAQLTGELDERARVNVLIAQQQAPEAQATADLRRLSPEERLELSRLLTKAKGMDDTANCQRRLLRCHSARSGLTRKGPDHWIRLPLLSVPFFIDAFNRTCTSHTPRYA